MLLKIHLEWRLLPLLAVVAADGTAGWFRISALANPIMWEVGNLFRYSSIGLGAPKHLALEGIGSALFALASFAYAVRSLREQG